MKTILWFAGVLAMWTGLKFVFMLFKRLGDKTTLSSVIDKAENKMQDAADGVAGYWNARKEFKRKEKERPTVTIH